MTNFPYRFFYRIDAKAKRLIDSETNEYIDSFVEVGSKKQSKLEGSNAGERFVPFLAKHFDIPEEYIFPITQDEYDFMQVR